MYIVIKSVDHAPDGVARAITHLAVAARWEGTSIQPGATLPLNIAYVTNDAILSSEALNLDHTEYVAIGMARISKSLSFLDRLRFKPS